MQPGNEEQLRPLNVTLYDNDGATIRVIDQMALDLYEALRNRQRCTACGGEGLVTTKLANTEGDPDLDDVLVSHICGCVRRADELLRQFESEYKLLAELHDMAQRTAGMAAVIKNGQNGK
jgi:hypothetical protein